MTNLPLPLPIPHEHDDNEAEGSAGRTMVTRRRRSYGPLTATARRNSCGPTTATRWRAGYSRLAEMARREDDTAHPQPPHMDLLRPGDGDDGIVARHAVATMRQRKGRGGALANQHGGHAKGKVGDGGASTKTRGGAIGTPRPEEAEE
ncbi:hypothetical protein U9M48_014824 [Paspalum notatum var. saurae]|uniref:Uncharacterized protein n=1 Tax=Paspalum notatum var. saurae TaxID=547442 RepID=A0AAQ3T1Z3_PASNO